MLRLMLDNLFWYRIHRVGCPFWDVDLCGEMNRNEAQILRVEFCFSGDFSHLEATSYELSLRDKPASCHGEENPCFPFCWCQLVLPLLEGPGSFRDALLQSQSTEVHVLSCPLAHQTGDLP